MRASIYDGEEEEEEEASQSIRAHPRGYTYTHTHIHTHFLSPWLSVEEKIDCEVMRGKGRISLRTARGAVIYRYVGIFTGQPCRGENI